MDLASKIFLAAYFSILAALACFGWHRYHLTYLFYRYRKRKPRGVPSFEDIPQLPAVTVQLPIYNEKYVVERLLNAACALDYPREKLEIQLLDDSTDETRQLAQREVKRLRALGYPVVYRHREHRRGYKAGALNEGLEAARGRFVAVFDADFVPPKDFLKKIIPYFYGAERFGMVQARWGHLNQDYSIMTQAQSVLLDGHFVIEHGGRNRSGRFFNFNGTAGVWDRRCIEEAGGWHYDTLTEDLDLSYRAQLKGWNFLYVPELEVPAELPVDMTGFKSQQHRWSKGSIQTAKKLIPAILKSDLTWKLKFEACFHLLNNFAYVFMLALALLLPVSVYLRHYYQLNFTLYFDVVVFILATLSVGTFYGCSLKEIYPGWKVRLMYLPLNLALGMGMSVNNSRAVLEALFGRQSSFQRTAKYAISKKGQRWHDKKYRAPFSWSSLFEIALGLYFTVGVGYALANGLWATLYGLMMFQVGFLYVGVMSLMQGRSFRLFFMPWKASSLPAD